MITQLYVRRLLSQILVADTFEVRRVYHSATQINLLRLAATDLSVSVACCVRLSDGTAYTPTVSIGTFVRRLKTLFERIR